jgi:murein L,D-transpeptidase YafK
MLIALLALLAGATASPSVLPTSVPEPSIVVWKAKRQLQLFSAGTLLKIYRIGLGLNPVPRKSRQGDHATPEGAFYVCVKNPQSRYLLSLGISYPGPEDAVVGLQSGAITRAEYQRILGAARRKARPPWDTALGGEVFIHGRGSSADWTWGCIALDDPDIRELYDVIPLGTPVTIKP